VQLTESGRQLRWVAVSDEGAAADPLPLLPTLATAATTELQPLALVLATAQEVGTSAATPAVSTLNYGTGRVVAVEGAGMWRWAFLAPGFEQHERVYGTLWNSLIRWLVTSTGLLPTQTRSLRADKVVFQDTQTATASLLVRQSAAKDAQLTVELLGGPKPRSVVATPVGEEPGSYRVSFGKLPEGRYEARIAGSRPDDAAARTVFDVRSGIDELLELRADREQMQRIAQRSGGAVLATASPTEVSERFTADLARNRPPQLRTTTAWDRWEVLAGVLGIWALTWGLRRRWGLI
jgi:hypothetical protein